MSEQDIRVTGDTLQRWREAEQAAAVARRGRVAAEAAAAAAASAADAAIATAEAARAALDAASRAESSASATAAAAKFAATATMADLADAGAESELRDAEEVQAKSAYQHAVRRAAERQAMVEESYDRRTGFTPPRSHERSSADGL